MGKSGKSYLNPFLIKMDDDDEQGYPHFRHPFCAEIPWDVSPSSTEEICESCEQRRMKSKEVKTRGEWRCMFAECFFFFFTKSGTKHDRTVAVLWKKMTNIWTNDPRAQHSSHSHPWKPEWTVSTPGDDFQWPGWDRAPGLLISAWLLDLLFLDAQVKAFCLFPSRKKQDSRWLKPQPDDIDITIDIIMSPVMSQLKKNKKSKIFWWRLHSKSWKLMPWAPWSPMATGGDTLKPYFQQKPWYWREKPWNTYAAMPHRYSNIPMNHWNKHVVFFRWVFP